MKPKERENLRYTAGTTNVIGLDERIMFSLLPSPPRKLLDVGCGVGTITKELEKMGYDVEGLDFSEVAVQRSKEIGVRAVVCDVDAEGIPWPSETFDVVWCGDILEHLFDPISGLKEVYRVLKGEGVVLISTPNDLYVGTRLRFLLGQSPQSAVYRRYGQCKHHTVMSKELLEYMLKCAMLNPISYYGICHIPKVQVEFVTKVPIVASWLATTFIVKAKKENPKVQGA